MQQMLEWVRKTLPMDLDTPRMIEAKIESLLEVEKEQIINARVDGDENHTFNSMMRKSYANDYYNETYANDTTKGLSEEDSKRRAWHY